VKDGAKVLLFFELGKFFVEIVWKLMIFSPLD